MKKKTLVTLCSLSLGLLAGAPFAVAQTPTTFTYQGKLDYSHRPANGPHDMTFQVFASVDQNDPKSSRFETNAVPVSDGLFTVALDFGSAPFTGEPRWLEISVKPSGANTAPDLLSPRTALSPTPYAIYAQTAGSVSNGAIGSAQLARDAVTAPNIASGQVVKSVNGLKDDLMLTAGSNIVLSEDAAAKTIQISAPGGAGGPTLPYSGSASSSSPLFTLHNSGDGTALKLTGNPGSAWPRAVLHVDGGNANRGIYAYDVTGEAIVGDSWNGTALYGYSGNVGSAVRGYSVAGTAIYGQSPSGNAGVFMGNVGIGIDKPKRRLDVAGDIGWADNASVLQSDQTGSIELGAWIASGTVPYIDFHYGVGTEQDYNVRIINDADGQLTVKGNLRADVLTITGGADLAEPFQMSEDQIPEGSVVVIDERNPGHLKQATRAYDTRVAGIVSGANGVKAGIALHQESVIEGGRNVALSGRVYVKADASLGAINPGDLLTTSDTVGHAMKVTDHAKAQGAIIGKAMTALESGKGMVLVLVSLQ